jgi:ribosome-associated protein
VAEDEEWCLVDYGDFVVHIMGARAREFYELETLWFGAEMTKVAQPGP